MLPPLRRWPGCPEGGKAWQGSGFSVLFPAFSACSVMPGFTLPLPCNKGSGSAAFSGGDLEWGSGAAVCERLARREPVEGSAEVQAFDLARVAAGPPRLGVRLVSRFSQPAKSAVLIVTMAIQTAWRAHIAL